MIRNNYVDKYSEMSPTKDRLAELNKNTDGGKKAQIDIVVEKPEETKRLKEIHAKVENIKVSLDGLKGNTARIEEHLESYRKYPTAELQGQLHSLLAASSTIQVTICNKLKSFEQDISKLKNDNSAFGRIQKLQYASLKQEFQELMQENRNIIESYRDTFKKQLKDTAKVVRNIQDEEELESLLDDGKPIQMFIDNILSDTQLARQQLKDIENRHTELLWIEDKLKEILDLFQQVALLVEEQQESINRVEYYAQTATDYVEQGVTDIGKGAKLKKKYRKCSVYVGIAVVILVLLLIIIIIA